MYQHFQKQNGQIQTNGHRQHSGDGEEEERCKVEARAQGVCANEYRILGDEVDDRRKRAYVALAKARRAVA